MYEINHIISFDNIYSFLSTHSSRLLNFLHLTRSQNILCVVCHQNVVVIFVVKDAILFIYSSTVYSRRVDRQSCGVPILDL